MWIIVVAWAYMICCLIYGTVEWYEWILWGALMCLTIGHIGDACRKRWNIKLPEVIISLMVWYLTAVIGGVALVCVYFVLHAWLTDRCIMEHKLGQDCAYEQRD
jgi:hypothetical protein